METFFLNWTTDRNWQTKLIMINNNDFISKALFHVKHAQLRCTMPMNNTHARTRACARARASKTSDERTTAYKSLKHNTIC